MKAILKDYRQSPTKVRILANAIKGMSLKNAKNSLRVAPQKAAIVLSKLLSSAESNAKQKGTPVEDLTVSKISVDGATTLKRIRPRARGSAAAIRKRSSHITVELK